MHPSRTAYTLASNPADYRECHDFLRTEAQHPAVAWEGLGQLQYQTERVHTPTILARRGGQVVGVMATKFVKPWGVVASPYHIAYDIKNHIPIALRLAEHYEAFLRLAGVPDYTVVLPNYKKGSIRIFTELHDSVRMMRVLNDRFDVYLVKVP